MFELFSPKILIIEVEESGVAVRRYFLWGCGPRHESADSPSLRSAHGQGVRGRRGVGRNAAHVLCHFFARVLRKKEIQKPCGSNPPFDPQDVLPSDPQDYPSMKVWRLEAVHFRFNNIFTRMSERLRTETRTVA